MNIKSEIELNKKDEEYHFDDGILSGIQQVADPAFFKQYIETHTSVNKFWAQKRRQRRIISKDLFQRGCSREVVRQTLLKHRDFKGIAESITNPTLGAKMRGLIESILDEGQLMATGKYVYLGN